MNRREHVGSTHHLLPHLAAWLERGERRQQQAQTVERVRSEVAGHAPANPQAKLPGDPEALRGIPAIGRSVSGATRWTRPGYDPRTGRPLE